MRLTYFILLLFLLQLNGYSQDKIRVTTGASVSIVPMFLSGTMDVGNGNTSVNGTTLISSEPVYKRVDTTAIVLATSFYIGLNLPFYKNENWSTGIKFNAGLGYQAGAKAAEGLHSLTFNFPQYIYWRRYKKLDYSLLAGYKYTYAVLPYHLMLAAVDVSIGSGRGLTTFRIYGSPFSYNYYSLYTNGEMHKAIRIYEAGLAVEVQF